MNAPFFKFGLFGDEASLVVAFVIGIGFGFFLERAGFGSARKLVSQFYLDDLAVFKVMFTAIVTAMLGVTYLAWMGLLDLSLVFLNPTYLWPMIVGGLVLGAGFVVGGYCPGTSVAATATGRVDALFFVGGLLAGTLVFAEALPLIKGFFYSGAMGPQTIPGYFQPALGRGGVRGGADGARRLRRRRRARSKVPAAAVARGPWPARWCAGFGVREAFPEASHPMPRMFSSLTLNQKLAVGAFVLGALATFAQPQPGHAVSISPKELALVVQREEDHVTARDLAGWIIGGRADFRLIDLRTAEEYAAYHIPGAENVPVAALPDQTFGPTDKVVLYSEGGTHSAQAWFLLRARGAKNAYLLLGGLESWKDEVLFPTLAQDPGPFERQRNEKLKQIAAHFGGRAMLAGGGANAMAAPDVALPKVAMPPAPAAGGAPSGAPAKRKKEGC